MATTKRHLCYVPALSTRAGPAIAPPPPCPAWIRRGSTAQCLKNHCRDCSGSGIPAYQQLPPSLGAGQHHCVQTATSNGDGSMDPALDPRSSPPPCSNQSMTALANGSRATLPTWFLSKHLSGDGGGLHQSPRCRTVPTAHLLPPPPPPARASPAPTHPSPWPCPEPAMADVRYRWLSFNTACSTTSLHCRQ